MPYIEDCLRFRQDDRPDLDTLLTALENEWQTLVAPYKQQTIIQTPEEIKCRNMDARSNSIFKPDSFVDSRARCINERGGLIGTLGNPINEDGHRIVNNRAVSPEGKYLVDRYGNRFAKRGVEYQPLNQLGQLLNRYRHPDMMSGLGKKDIL